METLRVLWIDENECLLFNSFDRRISNRCPKFVGKVAERLLRGEEINSSIHAENVPVDLKSRTVEIINFIAGNSEIIKYPIGVDEKKFAEVLVLSPTSNCNLRCVYCSGSSGTKGNNVMTWDVAKHAIEFFFDHTVTSGPYLLQFHGAGEPLTNFSIVKQSIEYAKKLQRTGNKHY